MVNLVVRNGFNGVRSGKDETTTVASKPAAKWLPRVERVDPRRGNARSPRLVQDTPDFSSQASDYVILLGDDVRELDRLALLLGIERRLHRAARPPGELRTAGAAGQQRDAAPGSTLLPPVEKAVRFGKQSVKWTKHHDANMATAEVDLSVNAEFLDARTLPAGARRRDQVAVPHLGLRYRLPSVAIKRHNRTHNNPSIQDIGRSSGHTR